MYQRTRVTVSDVSC